MIPRSSYNQPLLNRPVSRLNPSLITTVVVFILITGIVVLIRLGLDLSSSSTSIDKLLQVDWVQRAQQIPNPSRCKQQMHMLTSRQSLAGSGGDLHLTKFAAKQFHDFGVPEIDVYEYKVLLSTPTSSSLALIEKNEYRDFLNLNETDLRSRNAADQEAFNPYIAYSASGKINASVIYVNYGRKKDFDFLVRSGVDLTNHIGIARYGKIFRGLKVMLAERYGMSGMVIYSDPADDGDKKGDVFPNGKWRPPNSIQGGSSMFISLFSGDPLTPGVAAIPNLDPSLRKYTSENSPVLPKIPVLAIGYGNAKKIMETLEGPEVPKNWIGGLPITYRLGPSSSIEMDVQMERNLQSIFNVIGTFRGSEQPERRIMIGNHRDAWVYGAVDPHSGTVALLESARALASVYKDGWRPKRTLQICSWDAEEFGLVGSSEFVEQFAEILQNEAVVYLNVDVGISGNDSIHFMSNPSLGDIIKNVTKMINVPNSDMRVYDLWENSSNCTIDRVGSGSDYSGFLQHLGVPSVDFGFSSKSGQYGVYHSKYDDVRWFENFADPEYQMSATLTKLWIGLTMTLTDSIILPFRMVSYATAIDEYISELKKSLADPFDLTPLEEVIKEFYRAAKSVDSEVERMISSKNFTSAADINDRLSFVERKLLMNEPLPERTEMYYRHSIYAPDLYKGYGASVLPGLTYALQKGNLTLFTHQRDIIRSCILKASEFLLNSPPKV